MCGRTAIKERDQPILIERLRWLWFFWFSMLVIGLVLGFYLLWGVAATGQRYHTRACWSAVALEFGLVIAVLLYLHVNVFGCSDQLCTVMGWWHRELLCLWVLPVTIIVLFAASFSAAVVLVVVLLCWMLGVAFCLQHLQVSELCSWFMRWSVSRESAL